MIDHFGLKRKHLYNFLVPFKGSLINALFNVNTNENQLTKSIKWTKKTSCLLYEVSSQTFQDKNEQKVTVNGVKNDL